MGDGLSKLPAELLLEIFSWTDKRGIASLARTSKLLNCIITPTLYRSISLHNTHPALLCTRTLALPDNDLALMIQSFRIYCNEGYWHGLENWSKFQDALRRMTNLKELVCRATSIVLSQLIVALSSCTTLCSIVVSYEHDVQLVHGCDLPFPKGPLPHFPHLTSIRIHNHSYQSISSEYSELLKEFFNTHAHQLTEILLTFTYNLAGPQEPYSSILGCSDGFPELESLTVSSETYLKTLAEAGAPKLHTLTIARHDKPLSLSNGAFPNLTKLSCPSQTLEYFVEGKRQIKRLCLDGAWFDCKPEYCMFTNTDPEHPRHLSHDGDRMRLIFQTIKDWPLLDLAFRYDEKDLLGWLVTSVAPLFCNLARLMVYPTRDVTLIDYRSPELGSSLLKNLPHLRTFLLSDGGAIYGHECVQETPYGPSTDWIEWWQYKELIENWTGACPQHPISTVAFFKRQKWVKTNGQWIQKSPAHRKRRKVEPIVVHSPKPIWEKVGSVWQLKQVQGKEEVDDNCDGLVGLSDTFISP